MVKLRYVQKIDDRYYFRRVRTINGKRVEERFRLPPPEEPTFSIEYAKHLTDNRPALAVPGSMDDLVHRYKQSPEWNRLAESTRSNRERYLNLVGEHYGKKGYAKLTSG